VTAYEYTWAILAMATWLMLDCTCAVVNVVAAHVNKFHTCRTFYAE